MQISMRVFANGLALFLTCFTTACFLSDQDTRLTPRDQISHGAVIGSIALIHYATGSFAYLRWVLGLTAIVLLYNQKFGDLEGLLVTIVFLLLESYNKYLKMAPLEQSNDGRRESLKPENQKKKRKSQAKNTIDEQAKTIGDYKKTVDNLNKKLRTLKNEEAWKLVLITVGVALASIYIGFCIARVKAYWKATIDTAYEEFHVGNEMSKGIREFAQTSLTEIRKHHNEDSWAQRLQQKMNKKFPPAGWLCVMGTDHSTLQSFSSNVNSHQLYMFGIVKKVFVLFKMT
ncbi:hypothetical protein Ddc_14403 [Ditylenchus destructor]|nr:hypothetical protein Ddc_14403 [Ditylenchus destructor]